VQSNGRASFRTAVREFERSFGRLPGVAGAPRRGPGFVSGSGPLRWVLGYRERLSKAQLRAVRRIAHAQAARGAYASGPPGAKAEWTARVAEAGSRITMHLGHPLGLQLKVEIDDKQREAGVMAAATVWDDENGLSGPVAKCRIVVYPVGYNTASLAVKRAAAAHELFHCYQGEVLGLKRYYSPSRPLWLLEGSATWVGAVIGEEWTPGWTGKGYSNKKFQEYVNTSMRRLYKRSYDALGYFNHLGESANSPWTRLDAMLSATDNATAFANAVTVNAATFLDTWPSSFALHHDWGPRWTTVGPGMADPSPAVVPYKKIKAGVTSSVVVPDRANALLALDLTAPVIELRLKPGAIAHGVLRDSAGGDRPLKDAAYCTRDTGCCSPDEVSKKALLPIPAGVATLAVNGGASNTTATVLGFAKAKAHCQPLPPTALSISASDPQRFPARAITTPGQCFSGLWSQDKPTGTWPWVLNMDGFQIAAPALAGPGQYTLPGMPSRVPETSPYANVILNENVGFGPEPADFHTSAVAAATAGSFTVNPDVQSGTISAAFAPSTLRPVSAYVSGTWSCVDDHSIFPGLPFG
jgi:hypothetical protein